MKILIITFLILSQFSFVEKNNCFETTMLIAFYDGEIVGAERDSNSEAAGPLFEGTSITFTNSMFLQTNKFSSDDTLELIKTHEWETSTAYSGYISKVVQVDGDSELTFSLSSGLDLIISPEKVCLTLIQDEE